MSATRADPAAPPQIVKAAVISGVINAVINGAIQFFMLRGHDTIPMSVDAISAGTPTVLGSARPCRWRCPSR